MHLAALDLGAAVGCRRSVRRVDEAGRSLARLAALLWFARRLRLATLSRGAGWASVDSFARIVAGPPVAGKTQAEQLPLHLLGGQSAEESALRVAQALLEKLLQFLVAGPAESPPHSSPARSAHGLNHP